MERRVMPVKDCGYVLNCWRSPEGYRNSVQNEHPYRTVTKKEIAEYALQKLEEAWKLDQETHAVNLTALENNRIIRDQVVSLMESIGIPKQYQVRDPKSRSLRTRYIEVRTGYLEDLDRFCKTDDGFDRAKKTYEELKAEYDRYLQEAERELEQERKQREEEERRRQEERMALLKFAKMVERYGLDPKLPLCYVLDELCQKDQLLNLVIAMKQTRGDWSKGPWRVEHALQRFRPRNDTEQEIYDEIHCLTYDWEGDGRVYRDCRWNYDVLLDMVKQRDPQLVEDALEAYQWALNRIDA